MKSDAHKLRMIDRKVNRSSRKADNRWQIWERANLSRQKLGLPMRRAPRDLRARYTGPILRDIRGRNVNLKVERQR